VWFPLAFAVMVGSVALGASCLASGVRDRYLNQTQYTGLLVLSGIIVVQSLIAATRLLAGAHPVDYYTFIGYLLTTVLLLPAGISLARMEPTRWGSIIAGGAALTVAVLTLRSLQVWTPLR
jgi:cell shape-determining protein MreD